MKPIQLTGPDGNAYNLNDADGSVTSAAGVIVGNWSTDTSNDIVITKSDSTTVTIKVQWSFNATNQLCLADNTGKQVANFGPDNPYYQLNRNVLSVTPGDSAAFSFPLYCQWSLDPKNNLLAQFTGTPGNSTLTGYVQNSKTQFVFWFCDTSLAMPSQQLLGFYGAWEQADAANAPLRMVFKGKVDDGSAAGLPFAFELSTTTTTVNPSSNNLELTYADANGVHKIVLQGSLAISDKGGITFSIADQVDSNGGVVVEKRDLTIGGTYDFSGGFTTLQLNVTQTIGGVANTQALSIGGAFQAQIGAMGVQINFNYQSGACPTCGTGTVSNTSTLTVNGTFTWTGTTFHFDCTDLAGRGISFDVKGEMHFGKVGVDIGIAATNDPVAGRNITGFLGINWN